MIDAGLRVGEVVKLRVINLFINNRPVTSIVLGTGNAEKGSTRIIPVTQRLSNALYNFNRCLWSPEIFPPTAYAFSKRCGLPPLSIRHIERIIKTASLKSIGRPITPHVLRHTFATNLMRVSDIRTVQSLLGHRSVTSTQVYTHPDQSDMVNAILKMEARNGQ